MGIFGFIIYTIFILIIGGNLAFHLIYSPKAQIKKSWKNIQLIRSLTPRSEHIPEIIYSEPDKRIADIGKHINYLLEYYFDPEEDREYIEQNKWLTRDEQIRG